MLFKNLEAIGWSGAVAAAGYIAESGRESLFGIELHDFNFGRYASAVGYFVTSTADIAGRSTAARPWVAAAGFFGIVVLLTMVAQIRWKAVAATALIALPAIILSVGVSGLVHDEMPLFRVNNILVRNPDVRVDLGDPVASASWRRILCSHDRSNSLSKCADAERDPMQLEAQYRATATSFLLLVVLLMSFRVIALRTARRVHLAHFWFPVARTLTVLTTMVVVVFGLMLPYVHAKLIARTEFAEVAVTLAEAGPKIEPPLSGLAYELHHSDSAITLYEMLTPQQHVITETVLSRVALLRYMGSKDVLALHIQQSVPPNGQLAPPKR